MNINDLLKKQLKLVAKNQVAWQKIVKSAIIKHGATDKAKAQISKELKTFAEKTVRESMELGLKWLS